MTEIEENIFKNTRSITNPNETPNRIEFNFKEKSGKKWKKFRLQIEFVITENITTGNDNIEEKWNLFRNVLIQKNNKKIVIQSLLNRKRPRILTDSLTRTTNRQVKILTDSEEIKQEVKNVFSHCITSKNIEDLNQKQEWKQIYNQKNRIQEEWYFLLTKKFAVEEIEGIIRKLSNKKAPGPFTITNELWKHIAKTKD
ncbi:1294_t:CDS:2 [Diversispora eburnea]|uniref:1294_t:CDS:1 n=1 Tax=Diversispora eburnea TaxID=1213867 RepID=A0A9N9CFQ3_9GLOM|nr:1294_t:CDS:2 [Diversispora eburnea]